MSVSMIDSILDSHDGFSTAYQRKQARAELAQLRATVAEQDNRIAWLTSDVGEDGLAAINRLITACEFGAIAQHFAPDLSIALDEIVRQARQLAEARELLTTLDLTTLDWNDWNDRFDDWLAANAPQEDATK